MEGRGCAARESRRVGEGATGARTATRYSATVLLPVGFISVGEIRIRYCRRHRTVQYFTHLFAGRRTCFKRAYSFILASGGS